MDTSWQAQDVQAVFSGMSGFSSLDVEVQEFLAGLVADDPEETDAAFEESLGPFLEDSGAASGDDGVASLCAQLRSAMAAARAVGDPSAATIATMRSPTSTSRDASQPGCPEPASTSDPAEAVPLADAVLQNATVALRDTSANQEGADDRRQCRGEASWEVEEVTKLMGSILGALGEVDRNMRDYIVSVVAADAGEAEASFEDTIGPLVQGCLPGVPDSSVDRLCEDLRTGLDAILASCGAGSGTSHGNSSGNGEGALRRLAGGPVALGDLDDVVYDDLQTGGALQAHLANKARKEDQRMQHKLNARKKEAEEKRVAAEARARSKAEAAADRAESITAGSYSADSTVSNRGRAPSSDSKDIYIAQFTLPSHGVGHNLIESSMLRLMHGRRYGLVGRNGTGKSTLLAAIAGGRMPGVPSKLRILHVAQDSADRIVAGSRTEGASSLEAVVQSDTRRTELLKKAEALTSGDRLTEVYEELEAIDADGAPGRAASLLRGLQFTEDMMRKPVASLSGGWRMRVSIAAALFQEPDVLALDEPTNHLDLEAVLWLGDHLQGWGDKTLVVVSHDRAFLNEVCTDIVHLENRTLNYYQGSYDTFEAVRAEKRERQQRIYEQQEAKKKEMEGFVQKHLHKGQSLVKDDAAVKQAKKVAKQIERLGVLGQDGKKYKLSYDGPQQSAELPEEERGLSSFTFPNPEPLHGGAAMIQVKGVTFRYPGELHPIFRDLNFNVGLNTRCALLGRNGSGKSTLVKLIASKLEPTEGEVQKSHHLRVASFTQHHMEQLNLDQSPVEHLLEHGRLTEPALTPEEVRRRIGRFGMSGTWQTQRIRTLSGGQKSRVAFCKATWSIPHVLLLDEPSNHLDMDSIDSLIEAVNKFEGGIVCVSHDQHFLSSITEELWVVGEGATGIRRLNGTFRDYKKAMMLSLRNRVADRS